MSNNLQIAKSVTPTSHPTPYKQQLLFLSSIHHVLTKSHKLQQHCRSNFMSNISHLQQQSPHLHVQHLIHCKLPQLMSNSSQITKNSCPSFMSNTPQTATLSQCLVTLTPLCWTSHYFHSQFLTAEKSHRQRTCLNNLHSNRMCEGNGNLNMHKILATNHRFFKQNQQREYTNGRWIC